MRVAAGIGLGVLSGGLLALSFPPGTAGALAFVALVPALVARHLVARNRHEGALFLALPWVVWLGPLLWGMWPGLLWLKLLPLGIGAVVYGLALVFSLDRARSWALYPWECAAAMVTLEWLRAATPLGLGGTLALTQYARPEILQVAAVGGPWAVTFLVVLVNAAVAAGIVERRSGMAGFAIALVLVAGAVGSRRVREDVAGTSVSVTLVQHGQPSPEDADEILPDRRDTAALIRRGDFVGSSRRYLAELVDGTEKAHEHPGRGSLDLVVWPESTLQADPRWTPELRDPIEAAARRWDAAVVVPFFSPSIGATPHYDMLGVWGRTGELLGTYRKRHASYAAEYVAGKKEAPTFALDRRASVRLGAMICFDLDFLDVTRDLVLAGANLIAVPSDDGYAAIGRWHYAYLALQSAMHGVPLFKADTALGSAATGPRGELVVRPEGDGATPRRLATVSTVRAPEHAGTFYTRHGDWLAWLCAALTVGSVARRLRPRRRRRRA